MSNSNKRSQFCVKVLRFIVVIIFVGGFVYQTLQFLFLYWTYPTVVDIQQSSPSYIEVPAFTFCNRIGYKLSNLCEEFNVRGACANSIFATMASTMICKIYPNVCTNEKLPENFSLIFYGKFMERYSIQMEDIPKISIPLEDYLTCTIEYAGEITKCNMESVLGSFYTQDDLPHFCYTIYSLWGQPGKKRDMIPKGANMKFHLFLNFSARPPNEEGEYLPILRNPPCDPTVQIAVHSPYFLPSPFFAGSSFLGGRAYELRIKLSESHLLPLPYQTNCTDYMKLWWNRGGKAPINQLSIIQECRINKTYEEIGCIPVTMDYPHQYPICKTCPVDGPCIFKEAQNNCSLLADSYNQECDSMTYIVDKEDKAITMFEKVKSLFSHPSDGIRRTVPKHDCEGKKVWRPECSTIVIDVPFDRFEITDITYNPKYESLELFSVIGGYMGMWLGISLLTFYDIIGDAIVMIRIYMTKRNRKQLQEGKNKLSRRRKDNLAQKDMFTPTYHAW